MEDFIISVNKVEDWQTVKDISSLDAIFFKAKKSVTGGNAVILQRKNADGSVYKVDEISTLTDLDNYKKQVYKYL
jgi:hypothetical protein